MRIAQVAPLIESVPPKFYGGTERIVSYLTEELVRQGHDVTLFASGDSETTAKLVSCIPTAIRLNLHVKKEIPYYIVMLERVRQMAAQFDLVHFHTEHLHFPLFRHHTLPTLTTLHGRLDLPDLQPLFNEFNDVPLVSVSNHQRLPLPQACWVGTVYHGLPVSKLVPVAHPSGDYLAFLGRISPEKRLDRAIAIAKNVGMTLKIAAKIDLPDREYYEHTIRPLLDHPLIEYIGEIDERQKQEFLGNAHAVLFPIDWPEPFGLVMIEAFACSTPVIAFPCGAVPEIMENGLTGYVVKNVEEASAAVRHTDALDRTKIRQRFEMRFSAQCMAQNYVAIYRRLVSAAGQARNIAVVGGRDSNKRLHTWK
jgi:glycosyltransferase involved in cell wall biosynthesis